MTTGKLNPAVRIEFTPNGIDVDLEDWDNTAAKRLEQAWILLNREILRHRAAQLHKARLEEKQDVAA